MAAVLPAQSVSRPLLPCQWYDTLELQIFGCQLGGLLAPPDGESAVPLLDGFKQWLSRCLRLRGSEADFREKLHGSSPGDGPNRSHSLTLSSPSHLHPLGESGVDADAFVPQHGHAGPHALLSSPHAHVSGHAAERITTLGYGGPGGRVPVGGHSRHAHHVHHGHHGHQHGSSSRERAETLTPALRRSFGAAGGPGQSRSPSPLSPTLPPPPPLLLLLLLLPRLCLAAGG